MCTFSFVPTKDGYYAAMNRDERLTRSQALAPSIFRVDDLLAIYPFEKSGGTWIACNQHGLTLSLLNWNLPASQTISKQRSRGTLIPRLIGKSTLDEVARTLGQLTLDGLLPFRLIGILQDHPQIFEWRWDGISLEVLSFPWKPHHWFSSGASDEIAERIRGEACRVAWLEQGAGSLPWLRTLHSSHGLDAGPFSVCAHRQDAGTVSYSEIVFETNRASIRYVDSSPCRSSARDFTLTIPRVTQALVS
jgi:Transport and Golgi organisation 2